jgi:hypothetical protein
MASLFDLAVAQENMLRGKYINAQTGTTYTLALVDAGAIVTLTNAGAIALTVPANADVAFATNSVIILLCGGAGAVSVAGDTGVTVNSANSDATMAQNDWGILVKTGTNTWQFTVLGGASGGGGGYDEGTSFPGSPSTDDKFYRTDRNLLYFYDGTRWLTVQQYQIALTPLSAFPANKSVTTADVISGVPMYSGGYDFWMEDFICTTFVVTTNDGTKFWTVSLKKEAVAGGGATAITNFSTGTAPDTPSQWTNHTVAIDALLGTNIAFLSVDITKTSTPGNIYVMVGSAVIGRLVG